MAYGPICETCRFIIDRQSNHRMSDCSGPCPRKTLAIETAYYGLPAGKAHKIGEGRFWVPHGPTRTGQDRARQTSGKPVKGAGVRCL